MFEQLSLGTKAKKRTDELNAIVLDARHERDALEALFEQLDGRRGRLAEVSTTVEHVKDRAIDASEQLTTIVARIADLDTRLAGFEVIGAQVAQMTDIVRQAQEAAALMTDSGDSSRSTARRWSSSPLNTRRPGQPSKRLAPSARS